MFFHCCIKWRPVISTVHVQRRMKSMYHRGVHLFFKKYLLLTNSITSGGFMLFGDLAQQEIEIQSSKLKELNGRYDCAARMFIVGTAAGPLHHYYYISLDKVLPKTSLKTVGLKILSDQAIVSPLTILFFFYGMGILEKKSMEKSTQEVKEKFKYVYLGDCLFWPPIQFINFYYLPSHYRVVYINFATMVFNVFLSYMKHYDQH